MDKLQLLLSKGYFPKELPPPFVTTDFGIHSRAILSDWVGNGLLNKQQGKDLKPQGIAETEPEIYSMPKIGNERRFLQIVNPVPQLILAALIVRNWATVGRWLSRQHYSFSRTDVDTVGERAISEPDFQSNEVHKQLIKASYDYEVKSDVTRFYPSIYTHSIPWASYGKEKVKNNRKKYSGSLADRIDVLLRKCNRGQSVGIPIGPDTSRIVADIVSGYVDQRVRERTSLDRKAADRLQDDWLIGCQSYDDAEELLSALRSTYLELGLEIHGGKTSIIGIKENVGTPWLHTLQLAANIRQPLAGTFLQHFCEVALDLHRMHRASAPLRYALALLQSTDIRPSDGPYLQTFFMRTLIIDPRNIDLIASMLINMRHEGRKIHEGMIGRRVNSLVSKALDRGEHYEASWGLFLLKGLRLPFILGTTASVVEGEGSSVIGLILLDMAQRGLLVGNLPVKRWEKLVANQPFEGPLWLLGYEGVRHGWLRDPGSRLRNSSMMKPLFDRNIVYYDDNKNVPLTASVVREKRAERRRRQTTSMLWRMITSLYS